MPNDIVVRMRLALEQFSAPYRSALSDIKTQAKQAGAAVETELGGSLDQAGVKFEAALPRFNSGFATLRAGALGVAAAAVVIGPLVAKYAKVGDEIEDAAEAANIGVERFQTLREGMRQLDVQSSQSDAIFQSLNNTLGEVQSGTAGKGVVAALDAMGIKSRILNGEISTTDEFFDAIAGSASRFSSEAQFLAATVDITNKSVGVDLGNALSDGGVKLGEIEQKFRDVGNVIDEELIRELALANKEIETFSTNTQQTLTIWAAKAIVPFRQVRQAISEVGLFGGSEDRFRQIRLYEGAQRSADDQAAALGFDPLKPPRQKYSPIDAAAEKAAAKAARDAAAAARKQQGEAQREMREAERAREQALQKELELLARQGEAVREIATITERLDDGYREKFDSQLRAQRADWHHTSIFDAGGPDELKQIVEQRIGEALGTTADEFEERGLMAAQAIAQAFGGGVGNQVARIVGVLRGLQTGDFTSVGGSAGGILTLLGQKQAGGASVLQSLIGEQASSAVTSFAAQAGPYVAAYMVGQEINKVLGTDNWLGKFGVLPGILGKAIGLGDARKSSVSLSGANGAINVGGAVGNSRTTQKNAATSLGGSLQEQIQAIVEQLGGTVGNFAVSIGARDDKYAVDPTGRGMTGTKYGAKQFDSEAEAIAYAVRDAFKDGAAGGISPTLNNALNRASSLEQGLEDALQIKSVFDRLKEIDDPIGEAFDNLRDHFDDLRETMSAAGASTAELAELERLYAHDRDELAKQSVATLKGFLDSLNIGSGSPLSLTDQRKNAEAAFAGFESDIRGGRTIDQGAFVSAGQNLLDIERQISGGTSDYFAQFNRVQGLTTQAISGVENAQAIRDQELVAQKSTAESSAALVNGQNQLILLNQQILQALAAAGMGGFVGGDSALRGFVRAA